MKIEPTLLSQCADAGAKAAAAHLANGDILLVLNPDHGGERPAREAFAQAVIESYFPALDIGLMPLAMFVGMHPDVQEGELFSNACLRLIKERDGMKLRLAQLEWRPVSVRPTRGDAGEDGDVSVLTLNGSVGACNYSDVSGTSYSHWRPVAPPVPCPFDLWWSTATDEEKQDAARAGREGGAE